MAIVKALTQTDMSLFYPGGIASTSGHISPELLSFEGRYLGEYFSFSAYGPFARVDIDYVGIPSMVLIDDHDFDFAADLMITNITVSLTTALPFNAMVPSLFSADDVFTGSSGGDQLSAYAGNDKMFGGSGNDSLDGGTGNDSLYGGAGTDYLFGREGLDTLFGEAGIDYLYAGQGADTLYGGADGDLMYGEIGNDILHGEAGDDFLDGSFDSDTLYGEAGADFLRGSFGADTLFGGADNDTLEGGEQNDLLDGGAGADAFFGGFDIDTVTYASATAGVVAVLSAANFNTGDAKGDTYESVENVIGSSFADFIYGTELVNKLEGGAGNDTLVGEGSGDTLDGGAGSDTASYDTSLTPTLRVDLLTPSTNTGAALGDKFVSIENLDGSSFNDSLFGDNLNNVMRGSSYPASPSGDDKLDGRGGSDKLNGLDGKDFLTGGLGADFFVFSTKLGSTNIDTIVDFKAEDTIRLENTGTGLFNKLTTLGTLSSAYFKANATGVATDANDYIVYNTTTGKLCYDSNGNVAGGIIQFATLTGHPALTSADFVVI